MRESAKLDLAEFVRYCEFPKDVSFMYAEKAQLSNPFYFRTKLISAIIKELFLLGGETSGFGTRLYPPVGQITIGNGKTVMVSFTEARPSILGNLVRDYVSVFQHRLKGE